MNKSADAFRTIGEVADDLDVPKHVLRFWEGKFPQIKPMKRGGGRRYYRPEDLELLRGIRHLLHAEGYTIKGVQKILREHGIDQVKRASRAAIAAAAAAEETRKKRGRKSAVETLPTAGSKPLPATQDSPDNATTRSGLSTVETPPLTATAKATVLAAIRELERVRELLAMPTSVGQFASETSVAASTTESSAGDRVPKRARASRR